MNPDKFGVVIIQFLGKDDKETGRFLYDTTLKYKQFQEEKLSRDFYDVHTKDEFLAVLDTLINRIKEENYFFVLHIESHGDRFDGLGNCRQELVTWEEFYSYTRKINILFDGALVLVMAMCHGNSSIRALTINERAPYHYMIGSFHEVPEDYIERGFEVFYDKFFFEMDTCAALEVMGEEIGENPPLFWLTTNEYCFEQISYPKRDSPIFWRLLCNEINEYYTEHPATMLTLSEIAKLNDDRLHEEFEKAQSYKDYFLFKDKKEKVCRKK